MALVSLGVWCDARMELHEMKQHLYPCELNVHSVAFEISLPDFVVSGGSSTCSKYEVIGIQTLVSSSRRHCSLRYHQIVVCLSVCAPLSSLYSFDLFVLVHFWELTWGRGHSWHRAEEFLLQEDMADERDPAESAPKNTSCHMTLGGQ